ncbi:MAG TPA: ribokinase [Candidatus Eisenbacteria bacterium]|nr:ribokinase [Candidatus Eisenbacteria bacterium]
MHGGKPAIAVVGSCNVDLVAYTARVPGPGETVIGDRFAMGFGGKGANQAVMAARLGAAVSMVGRVGEDSYGEITLANFEVQGVDTEHLARVPGSSGVAPIWVEPDGTNRIIVIAGANGTLTPDAAVAAIDTLDRVDVVLGQLEIPQPTTAAAFTAAVARGAVTILNPAPAAKLDLPLLAATDWLIPNEVEFAALSGGDLPTEATMLAFAARTGRRVVVTLGAAGAALVTVDGRVELVAADRVTALDTTGAGDAFVGAFGYGLAAGLPELDAVRLGVRCASDSVTRPGTQSSFPDPARSLELLRSVAG